MIDFFNIPVENSFLTLCGLAMDVLLKIVLAFIVLAGVDYLFQRWQLEEQMKMTKQEIKEEYKRTEGDPTIKAEIRRRQQEMARHRMMQEVPKADVVVTNPIHVAVAIRYDATEMRAPIVVAKGMNLVAERIKLLANENDIPLVENPPLARALYKSAKVGKEIPADMYSVVAEVLTYLYRLKGKTFGVM
jgi:flagellar biosynthetic protein FlhB